MIKRIGEKPFHQWELNRQISVQDVDYDEIHWWNKNMEKALVTEPSPSIIVPNILLQEAENIYIFVMKDEQVVEHTSFGVYPRKQPEDYVYTETDHFTYKSLEGYIKDKVGGFIWYIDTDLVVDRLGEERGTLSDCMTDDYNGTWFYAITSTTDAGSSPYPAQYTIDGANGYLSLRDYVIWTGNRLVHIPTFEAKASNIINPDGQYSPKGGVDGLMSSTDKAYLGDLIRRYISACNPKEKNSGNDCNESGLYGNVVSGRPVSVIDTETPVGNMATIFDKNRNISSQLFLGQTTETPNSLHTDLWFRGNKDTTQWLRALTSDNFIRFVNLNYTGFTNWAVAPGIYKCPPKTDDNDRAFVEEYTMFVIPGAPEPDAEYLAKAVEEDRVKMREHAITQLAINDKGAMRVRYCPIPNLNKSVSGKCTRWFDVTSDIIPKLDADLLASFVSQMSFSQLSDGAVVFNGFPHTYICKNTEDKVIGVGVYMFNTVEDLYVRAVYDLTDALGDIEIDCVVIVFESHPELLLSIPSPIKLSAGRAYQLYINSDMVDKNNQTVTPTVIEVNPITHTGDSSVQPDWSQNDETQPDYVKNRTHWFEQYFEPIYANNEVEYGGDIIDASSIGFGAFCKISDQVLSWDQLDGATIQVHVGDEHGEGKVACLPVEETLGFVVGNISVHDPRGYDLFWGYIFIAPSAMDISEYGLSIPSAGTYITHNLMGGAFVYREYTIKKEEIHQLDEMFIPYKPKYSIRTDLNVMSNGIEYEWGISKEVRDALRVTNEFKIGFMIDGVPCASVMHVCGVDGLGGIQVVSLHDCMYLVKWRAPDNLWLSAIPFTPESYQTKAQIQTMIDEAIAKAMGEN